MTMGPGGASACLGLLTVLDHASKHEPLNPVSPLPARLTPKPCLPPPYRPVLLPPSPSSPIQTLEDLQQRVALLTSRPTGLDEFMAFLVAHTQQVRGGMK